MQDERFQSDSGQPTIEIFDIPIMEPMVTFTDLWITAVCLFALFKLIKLNKKGKVHQYIRWYFGIMALATFLGGVLGHAFSICRWSGMETPRVAHQYAGRNGY